MFGNTVEFDTSYWIFDGTVGPVGDYTASHYGFSFGSALSQAFTLGLAGSVPSNAPAITNIVLSHIYGKAVSGDTHKEFLEGNGSSGAHSNVTMSHMLLDGWQGIFRSTGQSGTAYNNWILEYDLLLNGFSTSANHGEWIDPDERPLTNLIVRYTVFRGSSGSGGATGTIVANNQNNTGAQIYGNVFDTLTVGNGIITGTSGGNLTNAVVYNNTFLNNILLDCGHPAIGGTGQGTGNVAYNNLVYNQLACEGVSGWTYDYGAFFSTSSTPSETHGQIGSGNPFVNSAAFNYQPMTDTTAGLSISGWSTNPSGCTVGTNCFNVDPLGVTRGANGRIDRGAFQIGSVGPPPPLAPTGLTAIVH